MKTTVIVSSIIDTQIQNFQPDSIFYIFNTIQDLAEFIENQPLRADKLYITRDVIDSAITTSLVYISSLLENPFLSVTKVEYVTEALSEEIATVEYLIKEKNLNNWQIVYGKLNREYLTNMILGTLKSEEIQLRRKAIYRQPKREYIQEKMRQKKGMDSTYETEESELAGIPQEAPVEMPLNSAESMCSIHTVAGINCKERSLFSFILAQYLSFKGKTLIIENDFEYLTLTGMLKDSGVSALEIDIEDIYNNTYETLRTMKLSPNPLTVVTCRHRSSFDYNFITNLLYNNLSDSYMHVVTEKSLKEVASTAYYIVVLPNNMVDILKTVNELPEGYRDRAKFSAVESTVIKEQTIPYPEAIEELLKELLGMDNLEVPIYSITSLKIGGEAHDLRLLIER